MELDIKTLSFTLLLTFFIQVIAFLLVLLTTGKYKGTRLWALGASSMAIGFLAIFLRSINQNKEVEHLLIMASNLFQIGGLMLFYVGSCYFFELRTINKILATGFLLYTSVIGYYTYFEDRLELRIIMFSAGMVLALLLNSWTLFKSRQGACKFGCKFVAATFAISSFFFILRISYFLFYGSNQTDFFSPGFMQTATFLVSIVMGLFWTFGQIIIVNERLNGELTESNNLFDLIFKTMPEGLAINDRETLRYIRANPGFSRITGYENKETLEIEDLFQKLWKDPEDLIRLKKELDKNGSYLNQEIYFIHKNGAERVCLLSTTLIKIKDKECLLSVGRDITDQKQKELELAEKKIKLEEMVTERDKFFSILAHDLRGPVSTALSLTDLMTDNSKDFSKEDLVLLSDSLNKSARSTNELLENLLEWAGLQRGIKSFSPEPIRFGDLLKPFLPYLTNTANNKNISLINDIPDDTLLFVDTYMAHTILRNLIINAIKFTREGGNVRLYVQKSEDGQDIFCVKDNGIGIDKFNQDTLFQIGYKNNRQGTNGEPSSGLGLLLCKEFVEKHKGRIWVESEVGVGSAFSFTLDAERKD